MGIWSRLTGRAPAPEQRAAELPVAVSEAPPPGQPQLGLALRLLPLCPQLPSATPEDALAALDAVLAEPEFDERWLPRAAELVPQLVRLLRQEHASERELVDKVSRDAPLAAEVVQIASASVNAARGPVQDLKDALQRIGLVGLHKALARTVLRPVFHPEAEPALLPAQQLLARHTDWQAEAVACAAVLLGEDAFDGYLAGLLQVAGWQALLRILAARGAWPAAVDEALAEALAERAHQLFGRAARGWELSPAFDAFAVAAVTGRLGNDPLTRAWAEAQAYAPT
jgi:hypothetical protein